MCGILDTNCLPEVFGDNRPKVGEKFYDWFTTGNGRLVVGGALYRELCTGSEKFRTSANQLQLAGRMRRIPDTEVDAKAACLDEKGLCRSDDAHVIALAKISGARLLCSNDADLQQDFKNKSLLDEPRGKVYSTRDKSGAFKEYKPGTHGRLLGNKTLCCP